MAKRRVEPDGTVVWTVDADGMQLTQDEFAELTDLMREAMEEAEKDED